VVFLHDDLEFDTHNWGNKLVKHFKRHSDYGIIGLAGSKYMPKSAKWWEDTNAMYGIVNHKHEGKKWESKYSEHIGNDIEDVIIVDGLFIAINKNKILSNFPETIKGFHFYDIGFSLDNYLKNVKIGIITDVRVTHLSIGITNDEWDKNRDEVSKIYSNNLPIKIKKNFKHRKLKVLIGCANFNSYTGSELHVYELARSLSLLNCDVSIISNIGGDIVNRIKSYGVKVYPLSEAPGFKLGDGIWGFTSPTGEKIPSEVNVMYSVSDERFDILHLNHYDIAEYIIKLYPNTPAISTIHSEVISLERPYIHHNIKKYVAIRPEIKDFLVTHYFIDKDIIDVVYNPIDENRFISNGVVKNNKKRVLFVGTIDYLRKNTILDLASKANNGDFELWLVGKKHMDYVDNIVNDNIKYFDPTWNVEKYVKQCDETASILLGRTTIEGWMCGKPGTVYHVDDKGNILNIEYKPIPNDINKFKSSIVGNNILEKYLEIL